MLTTEPKLFEGADPLVNDDRILSAIVGFDGEPGAERLLVSRDTAILLKAHARGLRAERLPQEWEVQAEIDPIEKELRVAQQELADLKYRQPRISLLLVHMGQQSAEYVNSVLVDLRLPTNEEIQNHFVKEEESCRLRLARRRTLLGFMEPTEGEVKEHLSRFREYLEQVTPIEHQVGRRIEVGFVLFNEGAAPASKIEIDVAGEGIRFSDIGDRPEVPQRPNVRSTIENFVAFSQNPFPQYGTKLTIGSVLPRIHVKPEEVEYTLKDVMHSDHRVLPKFDIVLPDEWQGAGFPLEVTLRVAELSKPVRKIFNVRVDIDRREPFART